VPALTIVNPDQYRDAIVQLVADNARRYAAMFGPDYAVQVGGIDGQVFWSQVSGTDVFLYVPYRYTIVPK
jgi:FtsP/CotA-like multicopper oxidase with cupredoxin domain